MKERYVRHPLQPHLRIAVVIGITLLVSSGRANHHGRKSSPAIGGCQGSCSCTSSGVHRPEQQEGRSQAEHCNESGQRALSRI